MKIDVKTGSPEAVKTAALVVPIPEGAKRPPARLAALDKALGGAIARTLSLHPDAGKFKEATLVVAGGAKAERVYLLGFGDPRKLDGEKVRDAAGQVARLLRDRGA
ncbi:MAG: leucyl aminopeptidase, partial [Candidatus Methylomirabilis sp.]|nr:leucyl aminopeptidase [Deltaproteobacteria bacterium]